MFGGRLLPFDSPSQPRRERVQDDRRPSRRANSPNVRVVPAESPRNFCGVCGDGEDEKKIHQVHDGSRGELADGLRGALLWQAWVESAERGTKYDTK